MPIRPGAAPAREAAAAWPNSWKPAESTVTANTSSSSHGCSNAWWVADASPFVASTQTVTTANATSTGTTTTGDSSAWNGRVMRCVRAGSVTSLRKRIRSRGSARRTSGSEPSASRSRPSGRS
ncbi:MAG: hypothetical protein WC580_06570 [Agrococcus sp.]